jgi:hypothetical protein
MYAKAFFKHCEVPRTDPRLATDFSDGRPVLGRLDDERLLRVRTDGARRESFDTFIAFRSSPSQGNVAENSGLKRSSSRGSEQQA